ncbi:unnamed protein product, partial [Ilex paraguariensis]
IAYVNFRINFTRLRNISKI